MSTFPDLAQDHAHDRFPMARAYLDLPTPSGVREPDPGFQDPFTERHLHCVWFDDRLRPTDLRTARGEALRVLRPGRWNQEAGPDFLDAEWELDGRRVSGDIEVHIRPMDWKAHGHRNDPRYRNVRLHVTYQPGQLADGLLPGGCEEVSLRDALESRSHFFFDSIDTSAYPWDTEGPLTPLRARIAAMDEESRGALLDAAGQERLRRKTLRMARAIQAVGPEQALYQALLRGLGYKGNAEACEEIARCLPVHELRREAGDDPDSAYALLLGVARLLPEDEGAWMPPWADTRALWDRWWRFQHAFQNRRLEPGRWRLDGLRPGNHPLLRLRAAADLFLQTPRLEERLLPEDGEAARSWIRRCQRALEVRAPGEAGQRLIGAERLATLFANAVLPWRAALVPGEVPPSTLRLLPAESGNSLVRRMAHSLFGPDQHPRLYRGTLRKQGLLQFHEDYGA